MRLKGKTALIAGASRNIGAGIALKFAQEGADLVLIGRKHGDDLKQVARECGKLGVKTLPLIGDLGRHADVQTMAQQGLAHFGKVDVIVSVAAIRPHKPFWEISVEEWHEVSEVNLHSTFYLARALAPSMMARKSGSIVAIGGMASLTVRDFLHRAFALATSEQAAEAPDQRSAPPSSSPGRRLAVTRCSSTRATSGSFRCSAACPTTR